MRLNPTNGLEGDMEGDCQKAYQYTYTPSSSLTC